LKKNFRDEVDFLKFGYFTYLEGLENDVGEIIEVFKPPQTYEPICETYVPIVEIPNPEHEKNSKVLTRILKSLTRGIQRYKMRDVKRFFRVFDLESDSYLDISDFIKKLNILSFSMKEEDKMTLFDYADPLKENKVNSDI
jgi:hypothetical protein